MTCVNSHFMCYTRFNVNAILVRIIYRGDDMDKNFKNKYKNLGLNIAFYRKSRGYTQLQLAELIDIDRRHMSAIELANVGASLDVIFKICNVLNVSESDLFSFRD